MISLFFECLDIGIETVVCSEVCWVAAWNLWLCDCIRPHFCAGTFSFFHTFSFSSMLYSY